MEEFGSSAEVKEDEGRTPTAKDTEAGSAGGGGKLLLDEERNIGAVPWRTYTYYLQATGAWWKLFMLVAFLCLAQAATVGNSLFLSFWSADEIPGFQQGDYMALYAALGVASALFTVSESSQSSKARTDESIVERDVLDGSRLYPSFIQAV
jgi:ATP-binding cassette subfamily C (CFTR/MRP) protein 1